MIYQKGQRLALVEDDLVGREEQRVALHRGAVVDRREDVLVGQVREHVLLSAASQQNDEKKEKTSTFNAEDVDVHNKQSPLNQKTRVEKRIRFKFGEENVKKKWGKGKKKIVVIGSVE